MKPFEKWLPASLLMLIIFGLSSMTGAAVDSVGLSKEIYHVNGHFILFFLLTLSYYHAVHKIPVAVLLSGAYAVIDEIHQRFVPGRSVQLYDIFIDILGALFAGVILWKLQPLLPNKLKRWLKG